MCQVPNTRVLTKINSANRLIQHQLLHLLLSSTNSHLIVCQRGTNNKLNYLSFPWFYLLNFYCSALYYSAMCACYFIHPHVCASLSWGRPHCACHPIRTKSDFTKRLHHLDGLLGSRHWDALQLENCLHSFSQQWAHSASAFKQMCYCLMFGSGSWHILTDWSKAVVLKLWSTEHRHCREGMEDQEKCMAWS